MQNFTLGKKGRSMLFLTFILLIGSLPSFGQACPEVSNSDPDAFCYLSTIQDLTVATGATVTSGDVTWYRDEDSTIPIPEDEFLQNGEIYFAGDADGTCTGDSRIEVDVIVNTLPAPISQYGNVFSPSIPNPDFRHEIEDLTAAIDSTSSDYTLAVYTSEYGTTVYNDEDDLTPGQSYFVGQIETGNDCYSLRIAIRYSPDLVNAPTAATPQFFCEGATVADLVAEGNENTQAIRWYSTEDSNPFLPETTFLVDGQSYWASQIVNNEGLPFPPTESEARTQVFVELESLDAGEQVGDGIYCQSEIDRRLETTSPQQLVRELFTEQLDPTLNVPTDGTFTNLTINEVISQYQSGVRDFSTTYTISNEQDCEDSVELSITIGEDFEAGDPNLDNQVCRGEFSAAATEQEIQDYLTSLLSEDVDPGSFSNISQITSDINTGEEGPFTSTYTTGTGECEDTAEFSFTISGDLNLEDFLTERGASAEICNAEIPNRVNIVPEDVEALFLDLIPGAPTTGTFADNTINDIVQAYNEDNFQTFTTTYTVTVDDCTDSIELSYTVIAGEDANAGSFEPITEVCTNDEPIDLTGLTNNDPNATEGGTFNGSGVENNIFDPSDLAPDTYTISYTVDESIPCVDGEQSTTFTIEVIQGPNAGIDITDSVCISELEAIVESIDFQNPEDSLFEILERFGWDGDTNGTFSPSINILGAQLAAYYDNEDRESSFLLTGTYIVESTNSCDDDIASFNITINDTQNAEAGEITGGEVCVGDESVNLEDYLIGSGAMTGGTFSLLDEEGGEIVEEVENGIFDPSQGIGSYYFRYTVNASTTDCVTGEDSDDFVIEVLEGRELGAPIEDTLCVANLQPTYSVAVLEEYYAGLLGSNFSSNGTFDPLLSEITAQYNDSETKVGFYTTTYTLGTGGCEDSVNIIVEVIGEETANAGGFEPITEVCTNDEPIDLTGLTNNDPNATEGGTFNGPGVENNIFDPSGLAPDTYTISYTVDESIPCVDGEQSTTFTIDVISAPFVGTDNTDTVLCNSEIDAMLPNTDAVRNYFLSLLDPEVSRENGSFNPPIEDLVAIYNSGDELREFSTQYTLTNGSCSASVEIAVTVVGSPDAPVAEAVQIFCAADAATVADIEVTGDNFVWYEDEDLTIEANDTEVLVDGVVYYAVSEEGENTCSSAPTMVTITIDDNTAAPVADAEQEFCTADSATIADLVISGNYIVYEDATLTTRADDADPLVNEGVYYAVALCGTEATTITVSISETTDAPEADADQAFCLVDSATVADLVATGDVTWYTNADLTTVADLTTPLADGTVYYAANSGDEGACASGSTMVTVSLGDSVSPTLETDGGEFCRSDNPTVQNLIDNLNGSGIQIYQSSTGGSPLAASTALENSVTYYATATDPTAQCESSERLAVNVEVGFCGVPEGFSPNGDNINDRFVIPNIRENYPNYSIEIYNRWGNMVYRGNQDWDGVSNQSSTLGDNVLPAGVYFYILNYNDGQTTPVQGKVYLSR